MARPYCASACANGIVPNSCQIPEALNHGKGGGVVIVVAAVVVRVVVVVSRRRSSRSIWVVLKIMGLFWL